MRHREILGPPVGLALTLAALMGGTWWWRLGFSRAPGTSPAPESSALLNDAYPLLEEASPSLRLSKARLEELVRANPFSPKRRSVPPPSDRHGEGAAAEPIESPPPRFTYKGRVVLGQRQRAILEEATSGKTYFLEVGQAVAGFKVLDIAENQVVLSDLHTHETLAVSRASPGGS